MSEKQSQARLVQQQREIEELQAAVGRFLTTFAMVESVLLTEILGSLSFDKPAMEHLEELMDFSDRLKLMLRLTKDRYPHHFVEAQTINKAAKDLAEHRNKIAHGAAVVALAGGFGDDVPFVAGIQKPRRELKYAAVEKTGEPITADTVREMLITIDEVSEQTDEAVKVQRQMTRFRLRLHHFRYGTPEPPDDPISPKPPGKRKTGRRAAG